jgi:hypothetical protein
VKFRKMDIKEKDLREKLRTMSSDLWGFKKFRVAEGRFEPGDYLFFGKGAFVEDVEALSSIASGLSLLFELDSLRAGTNIPSHYGFEMAEFVIE